ncbi:MAG TPA: histidine kinase [Thermoanaerobaculia bacterium]|nr:histidine kinase [Thermoanaerobaculia bacterium]
MPERLRRSLVLATTIVVAWAFFGSFFATQDILFAQLRGRGQFDLGEVALANAISIVLWMLVTPLMLFVLERIPLRRSRWIVATLSIVGLLFGSALLRCLVDVAFLYFCERKLSQEEIVSAILLRFHSNMILGAFVLLAGVLFDFFRTMREKDRRALTLETQLARAQLEQLRGQLQPHFLFNAINGIAALVHTDPDRADEMLMELAALLRSTLDLGRADTIPLHRELELVDHYLRIQTMRFHDRLRVTRTVDASALGCEVPALLLQPLLENSLRHVVARRAEGGTVELRVKREEGRLLLRVVDDGPGFDPATTKLGVGITNTLARLEQLYRGAAAATFEKTVEGFVVAIDLPAKECSA